MDKKLLIIFGVLLVTVSLLEVKLVNGDEVKETDDTINEDDHEEIIAPDDDAPVETEIHAEDDPEDVGESSNDGEEEIDMEQYIQNHKKNKAKKSQKVKGNKKAKGQASKPKKHNPKQKN